MPNATPRVSILVRSMDRSTLPRALDSAARQTYPNLELVVIAACGSEHAPLPAQWGGRPLRLVADRGRLDRAAAANVALDAAAGDWLNFLDDDDELLPGHVAALLEDLPAASSSRVIYAISVVVDQTGALREFGRARRRLDLLEDSGFPFMAAMFHRSLVAEGVRFDESLPIHEDLDFWIQCAQRTEFRFVNRRTNLWHAFIGNSGAGLGTNLDRELVDAVRRRIQSKWLPLVPQWAAELPPDILVHKGSGALEAGDTAYALALLEHAIERSPNDAVALNTAAMANHRAGNSKRAGALMIRALQLDAMQAGFRKNP